MTKKKASIWDRSKALILGHRISITFTNGPKRDKPKRDRNVSPHAKHNGLARAGDC